MADRPWLDHANVLLVDDDRDLVDYLTGLFQRRGAGEIEIATDGREALAKLASHAPDDGCEYDLVVTDVRMPGPSGIQLVAMARTAGCRVPFLVVTAFPDPEVLQTLAQFDDVLLIGKPFDPDELIAASARLLSPDVAMN